MFNQPFSIITLLYFLGAVQGFFLSLSILNSRSGNHSANKFLSLFLLVFSLELAYEFFDETSFRAIVDYFGPIYFAIDFLYGPLIYLYASRLVSQSRNQPKRQQKLHFLPFFVFAFLFIPFLAINSPGITTNYGEIDDRAVGLSLYIVVIQISAVLLSLIQIFIYLFLSIRLVHEHRKIMENEYSYTEKVSLIWLRNLLIAISTIYLFYVLEILLELLFDRGSGLEVLVDILTVILIFSLGYFGLKQPVFIHGNLAGLPGHSFDPPDEKSTLEPEQLTHNNALGSNKTFDSNIETKKYQKSALDDSMSKALKSEIECHMRDKKSYLNSSLTLLKLADEINISPHYLSQVINEQMQQKFFDFINGYRVEEAKQLLTNEKFASYSVLRVAEESGFNSKSAFYSAFKKYTGQTPTQFKKSQAV